MNPIIVNSVPCPVCGAPKGQECTREGGCGMRVDDFMRDGSFDDRLRIHLETEEYIARHYPEFAGDPPVFISKAELKYAKEHGMVR